MQTTVDQLNALNAIRIRTMPSPLAGEGFRGLNQSFLSAGVGTPAALNQSQMQSIVPDELGLIGLNYRSAEKPDGLNHAALAGMAGLNAAGKVEEPDEAHAESREAREKQVHTYAQQLVAQVFYGTMLKQMRNSPFKSELFSGGRGGQAYSALHDQAMSERAAKASGNKLTRAVARSILRKDNLHNGVVGMAMPQPAAVVPEADSAIRNDYSTVRVHVAPNLGR